MDASVTPRTMTPSAPSIIESDSRFIMEGFEDSDYEDDEVDNSQLDSEPDSPHAAGALDTLASSLAENAVEEDDYERLEGDQRNVRAKLSHPSSPRSSQTTTLPRALEPPSSSKVTIVIKDVAYNTYLALLYYVSLSTTLGNIPPTSLPFRYTPIQLPSHHYHRPSFQDQSVPEK